MTKPNIFLINLDSCTDRLKESTFQFDNFSLPFERISAIKGAELGADVLDTSYCKLKNAKQYYRPLTLGEIGCYLSHIKVLSIIVELELPYAFIFEDDVRLYDSAKILMEQIEFKFLHEKTIPAVNEPIKSYEPGSPEKESIKKEIERLKSAQIEIPIIINGQEIKTGDTANCVMPHNHNHVLATYHQASEKEIELAIEGCLETQKTWTNTSLSERCDIFQKMADLLQNKYRDTINASTVDATSAPDSNRTAVTSILPAPSPMCFLLIGLPILFLLKVDPFYGLRGWCSP